MRIAWLIAAVALSPAVSTAEPALALGVGELSCSKEIEEPLCLKLTERLVAALGERSEQPVVRQSESRKKQRACNQDAACVVTKLVTYERVVTGTVRAAEGGVEVGLRLLDARRMERTADAIAQAASISEADLLAAVDSAAEQLTLSK